MTERAHVQAGLRRLRRPWLLVLAAIVVVLLAGAALRSRHSEEAAWRRLLQGGVLRIATDASYPPFSAVDEHGALFGFDVDLAEAIASRWGLTASFENITYDALLGTLVVGRDDLVVSAFVPQPERTRDVAYTDSYFVGGTVAVVRAADGQTLDGDPLDWAAGQTFAVEHGAAGDALARRWARRLAGVQVVQHATAGEALASLEQGGANAALVDAVSAYDLLRGRPGLALAGPPLEPEPYVIAVGINSRALLRELKAVLAAMEADGTLPALREKWFGPAAR